MLESVGGNDGRQENTEVGAARDHGQSVKVEGMDGFGESEISPARCLPFRLNSRARSMSKELARSR